MPRDEKQNAQMRAQSLTQILAAARQLFAEQGYYACKVSDIAQKAEMSTGNLYWYFASKEDILREVLKDGFEAQEAMLREASERPGTALEKLDHLLALYQRLYQDHSRFFAILLSILGCGGEPAIRRLGLDMRAIGRRYHALLIGILKQGQQEGTVLDADPNTLAMLFFSLFNGLLLTYGEEWQTLEPTMIYQAVFRLLGVKNESRALSGENRCRNLELCES